MTVRADASRRAAFVAWGAWTVALALTIGDIGFLIASGQRLEGPLRMAAVVVAFTTLGAVVAVRRPENAVGWLFLVAALLVSLAGFARSYAVYGLVFRPGVLPGAVAMAWLWNWAWWPPLALAATLAILLFPDGRLPSTRWRVVAWASGVVAVAPALLLAVAPGPYQATQDFLADPESFGPGRRFVASDDLFNQQLPAEVTNPVGIEAVGPLVEPGLAVAFAVVGVMALVCAFSLVLRFARSRGDQRQQLKWMAYAVALFVGWFAVGSVVDIHQQVDEVLLSAISLLMAVAIGIAILRYRLYEIDRLISRTLSYGLLTGLLVAVYLGLVFALQGLLRPVTGESQLAVAGATLAVAALFGPLRRRLQTAVDRRFNRARYDAQRTVDEFRARLRDGIHLEQLDAELVGVVRSTVQPAQVSLWLRPWDESS